MEQNYCKNQEKIISDVLAERNQQDMKWGEQNHSAYVWSSIIGEEYGEMCKAINEFGFNPTPETEQDIYTETIQTMASCMAMLECMERSRMQKCVEKYLDYLKRVQRKNRVSLQEIHKRYLSREVAKEYGLTEEEIHRLDHELGL